MAEAEIPDAQWSVFLDKKCDLCETNDIKFKCLNCDELLCDNCKKTHLKSKMAKNHKVVYLETAEIYQTSENQTKFPTHTTKDLLLYCGTCKYFICLDCITSVSHQNHEMVKIETLIDSKQAELIKLSKEKSSKYEDAVKTIDKNRREFSVAVSQKIEEVLARNNHLKKKLDNIATKYIKQLKERDGENKKATTELKQRLQEETTDLNGLIQQYERTQSDRNMVQLVTDLTRKLDKYISYSPTDINCQVPNLITKQEDDQELENLFGCLDINTSTSSYQSLPQKKTNVSDNPSIDVKIVSSFSSKKLCVVTTGNNEAWIWSRGYKGMSLVTSDGKVIHNIKTAFIVYDVAVSTSGDLLVTMYRGKEVKKLTRNNTFTVIYTADGYCTSQCITVTDTGNVLVLFLKLNKMTIVEITTSGQHIRTIQHDTMGYAQPFIKPLSICTNINGDIIVVNDNKVVVAVNKSGTMRFIYDGKEGKLERSFDPQCIVSDKYGNIMITDCDNSVVHMLNRDGKFIQYLITRQHGCVGPYGISIDTSGRLWVGNCGKNRVLIAKFL